MSFLSAFPTILHAVEAAARLAAPFVAIADPTIGALMLQAVNTAVVVESAITTSGAGPTRAAVVSQATKSTVDMTNSLLVSQGKAPIPATAGEQVQVVVKAVVDGLNDLAAQVPQPGKPPASPTL